MDNYEGKDLMSSWKSREGNLDIVVPEKSIGGDIYQNRMKGKRMIGFDNWFTLENVFGHGFCFSNAEIMNVVANGLRGELVLEV